MGIRLHVEKKLSGFQLNVDMASDSGVLGILGASGSGKSMLLRTIAGLVKPDRGEITLNDRTLYDSQRKINLPTRERKIGFLFQNYALFPHLTLEENIAFGLKGLSEGQKKETVLSLMGRFHLEELAGRFPGQLSGGQQQRVALARAVAVSPDILLLDEPFSALDNHLRNQMMREMQAFLETYQGTVLYVTHNMDEAYRLCDRIAVLHKGKVEAIEDKEVLFQRPKTLEAARITGCKNMIAGTSVQPGVWEIPQWGISLNTNFQQTPKTTHIGIRANHIRMAAEPSGENCLRVSVVGKSEGPFRVSLYLKLESETFRSEDYDLQWEISRELLNQLENRDHNLWLQLPKEHIFPIIESSHG